jgi:phosphoribosylformylglycinamidine synthase
LCQPARLVVTSTASALTADAHVGDELVMPINHFSGNYTCDDETLKRLQDEDRIVLRYADNPNGSRDGIAGIVNEAGNVLGMMPHPENAIDPLQGSTDGFALFQGMVEALS